MSEPGEIHFESGSVSDLALFLEQAFEDSFDPFKPRRLNYQDVKVERPPSAGLQSISKSSTSPDTLVRGNPDDLQVNSSMKIVVLPTQNGKPRNMPPLDGIALPQDASHVLNFMGILFFIAILAITYLWLGRRYAEYARRQRYSGLMEPNSRVHTVARYVFHEGIWTVVQWVFHWPLKLWDMLDIGVRGDEPQPTKSGWGFPQESGNVNSSELGVLHVVGSGPQYLSLVRAVSE